MKTLLLSLIKERFYWCKNTDPKRMGYMNYILYDNEWIYEKYFYSMDELQRYMIDEISHRNPFVPCYFNLVNKRSSKRNKKVKKQLQAKYASKFNKKHGK